MSRISSAVRSLNAVSRPSAVVTAAVWQHSQTRALTTLSAPVPGGIEAREVERHRAPKRIGGVLLLIPAVEPDHPNAAVGESRSETKPCWVLVRRDGGERLRPRLALIA